MHNMYVHAYTVKSTVSFLTTYTHVRNYTYLLCICRNMYKFISYVKPNYPIHLIISNTTVV